MTPTRETEQTTIVVPTCDRAQVLADCVRTLLAHTANVPIIVVDNGSRRSAASVLAELESFSERGRIVNEPRRGASRARNTGLTAASTRIVAFVDDDVVVEAGWLEALSRPFADPRVTCVVGRIGLDVQARLPAWFTPDLASWYGEVDLGASSRELQRSEWGYGGNFAVVREVALQVGGFDERLGPGRRPRYNEDVDLILRVSDAGRRWYAPEALVQHRLGAERLTRRWILRRAFLQGRSNAAWECRRAEWFADSVALWRPRVRDVVSRRWSRTIRREHPGAARSRILVEGRMRRMEALGFWLERARASVVARAHTS